MIDTTDDGDLAQARHAVRRLEQVIAPEVDYSTGFRREVWPEKCHRCGSPFTRDLR